MSRRRARPAPAPSWGDLRACEGKIPFFDERLAKHRASEIRRDTGDDMRAYQCSACGYFHLGHVLGSSSGIRHADHLYVYPTKEK